MSQPVLRKPTAIRIQALPHGRDLPLPQKATPGSAGFDLRAAVTEPVELAAGGGFALVPSGIALELPDGWEAQVRPRSGLAYRHGVTVLNSPGTIDADYRGEIGVLLINHGKSAFVVERGERIAQVVLARVENVEWLRVDEIDETSRGDGGFGSSGRR